MAFLTREAILSAQDLVKECVSIPEWGGEVYVRVMTGTEREYYENFLTETQEAATAGSPPQAPNLLRAQLAALTLCDEQGGRLFSLEETEALGMKSWVVLNRIWEVARRLNLMSAEAVETAEKNERGAQSAASGSSSPGLSDAP